MPEIKVLFPKVEMPKSKNTDLLWYDFSSHKMIHLTGTALSFKYAYNLSTKLNELVAGAVQAPAPNTTPSPGREGVRAFLWGYSYLDFYVTGEDDDGVIVDVKESSLEDFIDGLEGSGLPYEEIESEDEW